MINRLRRKVIIVTMSCLLCVLVFLVITLNFMVYSKMMGDVSKAFDILFENNREVISRYEVSDVSDNKMILNKIYEVRYLVAWLDEEGALLSVNMGEVKEISSRQAGIMALEVSKKGKSRGFYDIYRYEIRNHTQGKQIIFINCYHELDIIESVLFASTGIAVLILAAVGILVTFFSQQAIRPVIESHEKQKQFITNSSHEIKTPLAIIQANTELIELTDGESEWTQSIRNQVRRLSQLTQSMTKLARMDEEQTVKERTLFSLSQLIEEACEEFLPVAERSGKKLQVEIEAEVEYRGDEKLMNQVMFILLDNAVKYAASAVQVKLFKRRGKIYMNMTNDVHSVEKGKLDKMFDRFYRGDTSRSSETAGFGIGLSLAQAIIESHHGRISARSRDGLSVEISIVLS